MVIFGGCTHAEAYNDLWRLRVTDGEADWVQLQTTGVGRPFRALEMPALHLQKTLEYLLGIYVGPGS